MEPKVTDRVDAVSKAGVSKQTREVNIERFKKRFALHFSFFIFQYSIFNRRSSTECLLSAKPVQAKGEGDNSEAPLCAGDWGEASFFFF